MPPPRPLLLEQLPPNVLQRIARMLLTNRHTLVAFTAVSDNCLSAFIAAANRSFQVTDATRTDAERILAERILYKQLRPTMTALLIPPIPISAFERVNCDRLDTLPLLRTLQIPAYDSYLTHLPTDLRDLRLSLPHSLRREQFFDALSELTLFSLHLHLLPTPSESRPPCLFEYPQLAVCLDPAGSGELLAASCPMLQVLRLFFVLALPFQPSSRLFPNLRVFSTLGTGQTRFDPICRIALGNVSARFARSLTSNLVEVKLQQSLSYDQVYELRSCDKLRCVSLMLHSGAEAGLIGTPFLFGLKKLELEWVRLSPDPGTSVDDFDDESQLIAVPFRFWSSPEGLLPALIGQAKNLEELRLCCVSCGKEDLRRILRGLGTRLKRLALDVLGQPESPTSRFIALLHMMCVYNRNLEWFEPANVEQLGTNVVVSSALHLESDFTTAQLHKAFEMVSRRLPFLTLPHGLRDARFLGGDCDLMRRDEWCKLCFDVDAEDLF